MADYGTYADEPEDAGIGDRVANSVKKIVRGVAALGSPHSIRDRKANVDQQVESSADGDDKIGRMKQAQSTDRDNSYSY